MRNRLLPLLLVLMVLIFGCSKEVTKDCVKARIVRITCASMVLQALDNNSLGEDGWLDITTNKSFDNVFNAGNSCHIASAYKTGDLVYITVGKPTSSDCIRCALFDAAPKISYDIISIGSVACEDSVSK